MKMKSNAFLGEVANLKENKFFRDIWLVCILKIFGITCRNGILESKDSWRNFFKTPIIFLYLSFVYSLLCLLRDFSKLSKQIVSEVASQSLSILLWHQFRMNSWHLWNFLVHLEKITRVVKSYTYQEKRFLNAMIAIVAVSPMMLSIILLAFNGFEHSKSFIKFWLLGHTFDEHPVLESVLIFFGIMVYYSLKFMIMSLLSVVYIAFSSKLSRAIKIQSENLETSFHSQSFHDQVNVYHQIIQCCILFSNAIKVSIFLILCLVFSAIYNALELSLRYTGFAVLPTLGESVILFIYCGTVFTYLISSVSKLPTSMEKAAVLFQNMYSKEILRNEFLNFNPLFIQRLMTVKALSEVKPVYITAWNIIKVDKSLLLNSFGCMLTFGILIMQLRKDDNKV
ncbi:uncharacterized protein CDAR_17151 [Caerostris darwini]|uniref:Gustatory receptor n=1 Tax=Caerostris darwini TaxID=1538125 RepID=A0AAV4N188_9ARAC|nr:uncharacterized protein CDAR_17151 [Caerostris darwini]